MSAHLLVDLDGLLVLLQLSAVRPDLQQTLVGRAVDKGGRGGWVGLTQWVSEAEATALPHQQYLLDSSPL